MSPEATMGGTAANQLRALGTRGVLVQMAQRGQIIELRCEMPKCYCHKGRGYSSRVRYRNALSGSPPAGVVTEEMLSAHDWYTTFAALTGASDKMPPIGRSTASTPPRWFSHEADAVSGTTATRSFFVMLDALHR
jgi:hypothetical protein